MHVFSLCCLLILILILNFVFLFLDQLILQVIANIDSDLGDMQTKNADKVKEIQESARDLQRATKETAPRTLAFILAW